MFKDNGSLNNLTFLSGTGNGILNLRKRIKKQKGTILFSISSSGFGLQTDISIPL
jgi:signal transduction histidine kinase